VRTAKYNKYNYIKLYKITQQNYKGTHDITKRRHVTPHNLNGGVQADEISCMK